MKYIVVSVETAKKLNTDKVDMCPEYVGVVDVPNADGLGTAVSDMFGDLLERDESETFVCYPCEMGNYTRRVTLTLSVQAFVR